MAESPVLRNRIATYGFLSFVSEYKAAIEGDIETLSSSLFFTGNYFGLPLDQTDSESSYRTIETVSGYLCPLYLSRIPDSKRSIIIEDCLWIIFYWLRHSLRDQILTRLAFLLEQKFSFYFEFLVTVRGFLRISNILLDILDFFVKGGSDTLARFDLQAIQTFLEFLLLKNPNFLNTRVFSVISGMMKSLPGYWATIAERIDLEYLAESLLSGKGAASNEMILQVLLMFAALFEKGGNELREKLGNGHVILSVVLDLLRSAEIDSNIETACLEFMLAVLKWAESYYDSRYSFSSDLIYFSIHIRVLYFGARFIWCYISLMI